MPRPLLLLKVTLSAACYCNQNSDQDSRHTATFSPAAQGSRRQRRGQQRWRTQRPRMQLWYTLPTGLQLWYVHRRAGCSSPALLKLCIPGSRQAFNNGDRREALSFQGHEHVGGLISGWPGRERLQKPRRSPGQHGHKLPGFHAHCYGRPGQHRLPTLWPNRQLAGCTAATGGPCSHCPSQLCTEFEEAMSHRIVA